MARNVALIAGSLTAAAVLALGLAAAGFGPVDDLSERQVVATLGDGPSEGAGVAPGRFEPMSAYEVRAALDAAGLAADGRVIVVYPDGTVDELGLEAEPAMSSMDELMRRMEQRLAGTDGE